MICVPGDSLERELLYSSPKWDVFRMDSVLELGSDTNTLEGVVPSFVHRLANAKLPTPLKDDFSLSQWSILWALILQDDFLVEDPLRAKVDRQDTLAHLLYRTIWEARFIMRESPIKLPTFMFSLVQWLSSTLVAEADLAMLSIGLPRKALSIAERLDALLFLLTVAQQNGLFNRAVFAFEHLDGCLRDGQIEPLRQIGFFLASVDKWVRIGCPIGILLGLNTGSTALRTLRKLSPKLHDRVELGLEWAQ
jgi:hypothetical protein